MGFCCVSVLSDISQQRNMLPAEAVNVNAHNMMRQIILDSLRISPNLARFKQKTHNNVSGRSHSKVP